MAEGEQSSTIALAVGKHRIPGVGEKIMLIIARGNSLNVSLFLTPEEADTIAEQMLHFSQEIRTGLVIPPRASAGVVSG